jgi:hypothetical protein
MAEYLIPIDICICQRISKSSHHLPVIRFKVSVKVGQDFIVNNPVPVDEVIILLIERNVSTLRTGCHRSQNACHKKKHKSHGWSLF